MKFEIFIYANDAPDVHMYVCLVGLTFRGHVSYTRYYYHTGKYLYSIIYTMLAYRFDLVANEMYALHLMLSM